MEKIIQNQFFSNQLQEKVKLLLNEDLLQENFYYLSKFPNATVSCSLKIKSDLFLSGIEVFEAVFQVLGRAPQWINRPSEGNFLSKGTHFEFLLPANIGISGERLALNLLSEATRVSTLTHQFVSLAAPKGIKILDTRKTTPGLRWLQKYAVRTAGGFNHRMGQSDVWMIKDNHKKIFGGLVGALKFFNDIGTQYNSLVVEIHSLEELKLAIGLGIRHVMLDNFSPAQIKQAVEIKKAGMTFEISGGITLDSFEQFLITGIDAISVGALTHSAPHVDISLKMELSHG